MRALPDVYTRNAPSDEPAGRSMWLVMAYEFLRFGPTIKSHKDSEQVDVEKCADGLFGAPDRYAERLVDVFLVVDV